MYLFDISEACHISKIFLALENKYIRIFSSKLVLIGYKICVNRYLDLILAIHGY